MQDERVLFNDKDKATRVADKHANAYVSGMFLGEGNTHSNVEAGLKQGLPARSSGPAPASGGHSCDTCGKAFAGTEMFGFGDKRFHKECFVLDKPCEECGKRILREEFVTDQKVFYHARCAPKGGSSSRAIESVVAPMARMTVEKRHDPEAEAERQRLAGKINEGKGFLSALRQGHRGAVRDVSGHELSHRVHALLRPLRRAARRQGLFAHRRREAHLRRLQSRRGQMRGLPQAAHCRGLCNGGETQVSPRLLQLLSLQGQLARQALCGRQGPDPLRQLSQPMSTLPCLFSGLAPNPCGAAETRIFFLSPRGCCAIAQCPSAMLRVSMKKSFSFGPAAEKVAPPRAPSSPAIRSKFETTANGSRMSAVAFSSLGQHLDERGCLSRDVRDAVTSVSSFGHQEVFYLWEAFASLADGNATLCAADFARLGRRVGVENVMHEWLFEAFDLNEDRILSFKDWALCVEHTTRSTCRDLAALAVRVLGETEADARTRAPFILARQKVAMSEAELDREVRAWVAACAAEEVDFRLMSLKLVQACCELVLDFFAPYATEMEAKLKRVPPLSVTLVCRKEGTTVPHAVRVLCERLQTIEMSEKPKCVDFAPDGLYVHRATVEAVANAFTLGYAAVEGLSADVLLMVLRTYLRHFTEPLWTLHVSQYMMQASARLKGPAQVAMVAETISALPATHRQTLRLVLQTAAMLAHDELALDTLTRILAFVLVRNEVKASSTAPAAVELVKTAISNFAELDRTFAL